MLWGTDVGPLSDTAAYCHSPSDMTTSTSTSRTGTAHVKANASSKRLFPIKVAFEHKACPDHRTCAYGCPCACDREMQRKTAETQSFRQKLQGQWVQQEILRPCCPSSCGAQRRKRPYSTIGTRLSHAVPSTSSLRRAFQAQSGCLPRSFPCRIRALVCWSGC